MNMASKEYSKKKRGQTKTKTVEEKPEWFDQSFETKKPTEEKLKEMQDLLGEFR